MSRFLGAISESMNTEHDFAQMKKFTEDNAEQFKDVKLGVKQALENIQLNVQWRSQYYATVIEWLTAHANEEYFA